MLVYWVRWHYCLSLVVSLPKPNLGHWFCLLTSSIQFGFKLNDFLNKLTLFYPNTNLNWSTMISIKNLTNHPYIRHIYKGFDMLYTTLACHSIFQHFVRTSDTSSCSSTYRLFHRHINFSLTIYDPFDTMPEPLIRSPIFCTSINPPV